MSAFSSFVSSGVSNLRLTLPGPPAISLTKALVARALPIGLLELLLKSLDFDSNNSVLTFSNIQSFSNWILDPLK